MKHFEDYDGVAILSKEKADKQRVWQNVTQIYEHDGTIQGTIIGRIKGGLSVNIGVKAFLPGSQIDLRPVRNLDQMIGETYEFKILKLNQRRGNIVLSRRYLLEVERHAQREETLDKLQEGLLIKGHVKNITDYGVFVDLGGIDGLLHITDMTWGRINHPSELFQIGEETEVIILKYVPETQKVSLGLKQKEPNPWENIAEKYAIGTRISGKIVSLADYGAFIQLESGIEGLIHVSEISWTKKVRNPNKMLKVGQEVEAIIKDINIEAHRISLSIKEGEPNPWLAVFEKYPIGSVVIGKIRNITEFGVFVGLDEGVDGLVHVSDLSWNQRHRQVLEEFKKNDQIEAKVLNIDVDQERLSLGVKQLSPDPWRNLEYEVQIGDKVRGNVASLTEFGIFVEVVEGVEGLIHISEIDPSIKGKIEKFYPIGSQIEAHVIKVDSEERRLGLSIIDEIPTEYQKLANSDQNSENEITQIEQPQENIQG